MRSKILVVLAIAIVAGTGWIAYRNYNGYCKGKRLTGEEIVAIAQRDAFQRYQVEAKPPVSEVLGEHPVTYEDFGDFLERNSDCCKVVEKGAPGYRPELEVGNWPRYQGRFRAWFVVEVDAGNGHQYKYMNVISNCGRTSANVY